MRAIAISAIAISFAAAAGPPVKTVDLNRPGVLEAIEQRDKPLYERIHGVLKAAEIEPCESLPKLVQALHVGMETCNGHDILTSYPAKIRVSFRIDDTLYSGNVIQPKITGEAHPAKQGIAK
jgi:hypothetical protein